MPTMKDILRQLFRLISISSLVSILLWQTREGFKQPHGRETFDIFRRNQLMKQYEESVQFNAHELYEANKTNNARNKDLGPMSDGTTANMVNVSLFKRHEPETYRTSNLRNAVQYDVMEHGTKNSDLGCLMDNWVAEVEVHDYEYLINPHQKCDVPPHLPKAILLVICVLSAPQNWERRGVIRSTYGNESVWPASREGASMVRVVFMLGAVKDVALQASIEAEAARFGDIVQENFVDSYINLTRKTVMTLKWVTKFCGNAIFMMKADDDIILNVQKVTTFLLLSPPEDFTAGKKGKPIRVMRTKNSKYYTPYHVYNSTHYDPYYLGGAGYFFSLDVAYRILDVAQRIPLFPWEDIFVSNCMRELGIPITRTKNFAWGKYTVSNGRLINDTQCIRFRDRYLVAKGLPANHMMKLWTYTQTMA
nr:lactosylceramide 1,3-N-acetyl-beta-D-glucosaminyltransferase B-like [Lytechinus pictus]